MEDLEDALDDGGFGEGQTEGGTDLSGRLVAGSRVECEVGSTISIGHQELWLVTTQVSPQWPDGRIFTVFERSGRASVA
jgi:hypothetical protein